MNEYIDQFESALNFFINSGKSFPELEESQMLEKNDSVTFADFDRISMNLIRVGDKLVTSAIYVSSGVNCHVVNRIFSCDSSDVLMNEAALGVWFLLCEFNYSARVTFKKRLHIESEFEVAVIHNTSY